MQVKIVDYIQRKHVVSKGSWKLEFDALSDSCAYLCSQGYGTKMELVYHLSTYVHAALNPYGFGVKSTVIFIKLFVSFCI